MAEPNQSDPENSTLRVPACDSCRARKIRCDRKNPCASCKTSRIACRTTKRNAEKRQRILVSGRYEREIEDINGRLASLERILQDLVKTQKHSGSESIPSSHTETLSTPRGSQLGERELEFEGESSFVAHSKHVTRAFESSLNNSPYSGSVRDVSAAVATLRTFLNENSPVANESTRFYQPLQEAIYYPELSGLALPPMQAVLRLLRHAHPHKFFYDIPTLDIAYITNLCHHHCRRMVQDAGYHRLPPYTVNPTASKKRLVFWTVYALDRGMGLNLGRSPTLQDCDISVDRPKMPEEIRDVWGAMYLGWLDYAELQGHIYEQLYCARAQKQPTKVRAELARGLASRLIQMKEQFVFDFSNTPFAESFSDAMISVQIVLSSTLTLVYRAWSILQHRANDEWRLFIHWTLLWCPFIPYIVVFGNIIADRNKDDIRLLEHVVNTLIFYQIANIYLGRDNSSVQQAPQVTTSSASNQLVLPRSQQSLRELDTQLTNTILPDLPLSQQDWDGMLDERDLGLGAENAKEMSNFFGNYLSGSGSSLNGSMTIGNQEGFD
ncbi:uncharacterized protein Z518_09431 [Rhinocladiella mackenziei CBS 650.93]|uniref:Zn(2)-C6 fungal-type domain-containing protein n=1 Tax=Rhinocladiella mackenziei CBS 650.93 TaxID=1442369 RepID=A0A0D2IYL0_9EURO|nr:uncharacterized protein Z518_09431 [Rhinocladiella mackenziei CBS 650.93]KIX01705.1 hypothetical protein Z518_09431 [Rhinocladiella mackenziei CBS 650.93]